MSSRMTTTRRLLAALSAPLVMAGLVVAPASTAQAHNNVWVDDSWILTSYCGCFEPDPHDGTYFQYDSGGHAYKGEIYSGQDMVGKVEFHPYDEKVWVYDTRANGDGLYTQVSWWDANGRWHRSMHPPRSGHSVTDLDIPEGTQVRIEVWDDNFYDDDSEILDEYAYA